MSGALINNWVASHIIQAILISGYHGKTKDKTPLGSIATGDVFITHLTMESHPSLISTAELQDNSMVEVFAMIISE